MVNVLMILLTKYCFLSSLKFDDTAQKETWRHENELIK